MGPTVLVSRREHFSGWDLAAGECAKLRSIAAHRLYSQELSPDENRRIFGKCCHVHGHNYDIEVIVKGPVSESGAQIEFKTYNAPLAQNENGHHAHNHGLDR